MTSITDENGKTASVLYTQSGNSLGTPDADFWRPFGATDQLSNGTSFTYPSATASESSMLFNSGRSVVDHRATLDGFARKIVAQTLQAPGGTTYDSVQTSYDAFGRASEVFRPYSAAKDTACSGTCPGIATTYDALNRPLTITDGGNGKIAYSYTANDVLQTISPAPTGEHTKQKQLEYDSLGRLISVCEITSVSGSGACGQTNSATGFLTKYTYDAQGDLIGVSQNAQPGASATQSRTYTFDEAGRILTESNPETGGITYVYDSWDSACGTYTSSGDLVEKKDAVGNVTCMKYDALHRPTDITYPSGSYASVTDQKHFVYDAATVNGVGMTNAKTRLAEAYTGTAASKKTDEGFSYDARGQMIDVYESTPNSGGYYHVNATYWANGKLDVLNGGTGPLPGLPAITYGASDGSGLDGEGRVTKVNAATGQNPVTSVGYNIAQQVTGVTFGSADSDSYQYDVSTGRMTKYTFNMGTGPTTQIGTLTWNANGTLGTLQIADQINTANSQTCTFGYDDLVRITSANCGSVWSQTFGLDPFGNLTKSGSGQFLPMYNLAKNQYSSIPGGSTTAYDANGNLKNDVTHSYTWDADGNMLSTDGTTVTMIYDALDRMIEQTRSSGHTQIVYGPYGLKLALMNGQTLVNAFVKLPGGARAVYNSSGLAYYRHSDHLGSSRLATTPSRAKQYDVAYAPYGEDYNGSGTQDLAFTDQNQDTVKNGWSTNLYDFMFREYRTAHGRWTRPDPAGRAAVNPANPQSWNRYAYAVNHPLGLVDALGLAPTLVWVSINGQTYFTAVGGDSTTVSAGGGDAFDDLGGGNANNVKDPESRFQREGSLGGAGRGPLVDTKALGSCLAADFGVTLLSFSPSIGAGEGGPGNVNGSATIDFFNLDIPPVGSVPVVGTITNDINTYGPNDVPTYSVTYDNPNLSSYGPVQGWSNASNPWTNYTVNSMVDQGATDTQIQELGNSIAYVLGVAPSHEKDPSEDPGYSLLGCYQNTSGAQK